MVSVAANQSFFGKKPAQRRLYFAKKGFLQQPVKILLKFPRKNLSVR